MEETLSLLENFLEDIYQAQHRTEILLLSLSQLPHGCQELYQKIKPSQGTCINVSNIIEYWEQSLRQYEENPKSIDISNNSTQIISNYFGIPMQQKITLQSFEKYLRPKQTIRTTLTAEQLYQGPTDIFCQIISTVISGFNSLQVIRKKLCKFVNQIQAYFAKNYDSGNYLSRDSLYRFMEERNIYTKNKFMQVEWYIFGENLSSILWELFLSDKRQKFEQNYEEDCLPLVLKRNHQIEEKEKTGSYKKLKLNGDWGNQQQRSQSLKNPGKCQKQQRQEGVNEILEQISQIEQKFKEKLQKKSRKSIDFEQKPLAPIANQKRASQQCQNNSMRRNSSQAGKLVCKTSSNRYYEINPRKYQQPSNLQEKQNFLNEDFNEKQQGEYIGKMYNKYFGGKTNRGTSYKPISRRDHIGNGNDISSFENYRKMIHSSASQAQLKIQQIERSVAYKMAPRQMKYSNRSILDFSNRIPIDFGNNMNKTWNRVDSMTRLKTTTRVMPRY